MSEPSSLRAAVSLTGVTKTFSEGESSRQVLKALDLEVSSGESVALLGASGSGKSTLLNILAGLTLPDSGTVEVAGRELHHLDEEQRTLFRRREIGFIFQFFHLVPTLTVAENLRLPLQLNGLDHGPAADSVQTYLQRLGLGDRAEALPDRLSGGEQQRVAVARALIHSPKLVLADEPTGNLDAATARSVLDLVFELTGELETTLVVVTHSEEVAGFCRRALRIEAGQLQPA